VPITFTLELTDPKTAGQALTHFGLSPKGRRIITAQAVELNMTLYRDNVREFLNKVIPHEMAHLNQQWKNIRSGSDSIDHGYVWQSSMRAMSQVPTAKHKMDVTKAIAVYKEHKAKARKAKKEANKA
jgi:predicted SprT family Zn-dependent metalloprotease